MNKREYDHSFLGGKSGEKNGIVLVFLLLEQIAHTTLRRKPSTVHPIAWDSTIKHSNGKNCFSINIETDEINEHLRKGTWGLNVGNETQKDKNVPREEEKKGEQLKPSLQNKLRSMW